MALEVDLVLGAKLIAGIKEDFQGKAIAILINLNIFEALKIHLLSITKSKHITPYLETILDCLISKKSHNYYSNSKI